MSIWSALGVVEVRRGAGRYVGGCPFGRFAAIAVGTGGAARGGAGLAACHLTFRGQLGHGRRAERPWHFNSNFVTVDNRERSVGELSVDGLRGR